MKAYKANDPNTSLPGMKSWRQQMKHKDLLALLKAHTVAHMNIQTICAYISQHTCGPVCSDICVSVYCSICLPPQTILCVKGHVLCVCLLVPLRFWATVPFTSSHYTHSVYVVFSAAFLFHLSRNIFGVDIGAPWPSAFSITIVIILISWICFMYQYVCHPEPTVPHCGFNLTPTWTLWEWVWVVARFLKDQSTLSKFRKIQ